MTLRSILANHSLTWLSQEEYVGDEVQMYPWVRGEERLVLARSYAPRDYLQSHESLYRWAGWSQGRSGRQQAGVVLDFRLI